MKEAVLLTDGYKLDHRRQYPEGITTLSGNYKKVYFTNSYKDWDNEVLPNNVEVIKVV